MRNSSSLDWLRFMHTPNDYRVSLGITCIASSFAGEADRECCMRMKKEYGNTIKRFK